MVCQDHFFSWHVWYNCISVVIVAFFVDGGFCMDGFLLYNFKKFVVIVYCDVSAIYICVNFFLPKVNRQAFELYVGISGFDIGEGLGSEGN